MKIADLLKEFSTTEIEVSVEEQEMLKSMPKAGPLPTVKDIEANDEWLEFVEV